MRQPPPNFQTSQTCIVNKRKNVYANANTKHPHPHPKTERESEDTEYGEIKMFCGSKLRKAYESHPRHVIIAATNS